MVMVYEVTPIVGGGGSEFDGATARHVGMSFPLRVAVSISPEDYQARRRARRNLRRAAKRNR